MTRPIIKLLACSILLLPVIVGAQAGGDEGYLRLVGLPFEQRGNQDINVYIQALYRLAIGVAASLAVLRLILAGAQYMFTDVVTKKADAKKNVQSSLIGLLIVLSAVLILNTINPQLTNLEALDINQITITVDPSQLPGNGYQLQRGDSIRACPDGEAAACQSVCGDGTVVTGGVRRLNGQLRDENRAVCVVPATGETPILPGDTVISDGLIVNENTRYTIEGIRDLVQQSRDLGIYVYDTPVLQVGVDDEIAVCEADASQQAYIIRGEALVGDRLLCVTR